MTQFSDPEAGRSITHHLGLTLRETGTTDAPRVEGLVPALDHLRAPAGNVRVGALLTLADSVAGLCAGLAVLPGWVVSTNLMLRTASFNHAGPLRCTADVRRAGRHAVVTGVRVLDGGRRDALVADAVLTSAVLQPEGGPPAYARPLVLEAPPVAGTAGGFSEFLGTRALDATTVAIDVAEHLRNPWGILHGGAIAALVDDAAEHASGRGTTTADVVLHFLAPGRLGPVVARAQPVGERPDGKLLRVEVRDTAAGDRVVAVAVATTRVPEP